MLHAVFYNFPLKRDAQIVPLLIHIFINITPKAESDFTKHIMHTRTALCRVSVKISKV